jgi:folylpolyglutamate synthase/dihydropteroate synthase
MVSGAAAIDNNDVVFITGSLFLVAEARAIIGGKP